MGWFQRSVTSSAVHECHGKEAYNDWLCKQLPLVSETFTEDATMLDSNSSLKDQAESKAAQILDPLAALKPIYVDSHIVVVNKPSGGIIW